MAARKPRQKDRSGLYMPKDAESAASKVISLIGGKASPGVSRLDYPEFYEDFLPFDLDELPLYQPEPGSKWQPWTPDKARRQVEKYPDAEEFWRRTTAYLDAELAAGSPPEWQWHVWRLLEEEWWRQGR